MYESFFGFNRRPFSAVPDLSSYFTSRNEEQIRATLARVLRRSEGPAVVLGGTGFGKTTTALRLATDIAKDFQVVFLQGAQLCSRRALLQSILAKLNLPYRDLGEGELRLSLYEYLQPSSRNPSPPVALIVDEADTLPVKLLEEIRALSNVVISGDARVRAVLVGSMRLEHSLANPQLEALNQRLAVRCYLTAWNYEEVQQEIRYQIQSAGAKPENVCTSEALIAAYRATEGIPRLVHQLVDHALLLGFNYGQKPISAALIEEAWADLQQLPCPWSEGGEIVVSAGSSSIEFGSLDESSLNDAEGDFSISSLNSGNDVPDLANHLSPARTNAVAQPNDTAQPNDIAQPNHAVKFDFAVVPSAVSAPVASARNVFGDDFDEEVVVASPSSKSPLSVTETFVTAPAASISENVFSQWGAIADAFQDEPSNSNSAYPISSIFPASEIEEELQDAIGSLNYSSITAEFNIHRLNELADDREFDDLFGSGTELNAIGDDRDILIVEDDIDAKKLARDPSGTQFQFSQSPSRLFSQLKQF